MDDNRLDELLTDAVHSYRPPPDAPLDAIWARVEAEAFDGAAVKAGTGMARVRRRDRRDARAWRARRARHGEPRSLDAACVDLRAARRGGSRPLPAVDPYQQTTQEFLGRTAVLLAALPSPGKPGIHDEQLTEQARQLLGTTRLLLDSPVGHEQRMKDLLEDLELVLAQVARLQSQRPGEALTLINEALEERDVVPRIRSAVADLSGSDH